ncbi:hypothetical protein GCM10010988_23830 [Cnuibacter physcomitrellae]|uniref:Uncharacterized protein n=1 Tax=Cnuibacter physcomitrellae TaxID=1619308 RepID=A0A1X9LSY8_9MICO|nr:DUF2470 domain-containing protein [Cnuibacter physcomitrellae]ARJ07031.1 hypothetical protein B5808_18725 [Cnuibacter physcomitrellae]GGI39390.1 hypothetical protein GCM10010988_23830 [Cnuibacter physcomitrellae]
MSAFDPDVVQAILRHMNGDHTDDNILIARAFVDPSAEASVMTGYDADGGTWEVTTSGSTRSATVAWPNGPIAERPDVRREIVALYDEACAVLGVEPRPHA